MSKFKYSEFDKKMNSVLKHQDETLSNIHFPSAQECDTAIEKTESLLRELGYEQESLKGLSPTTQEKKIMVVPTWDELCEEAKLHVGMEGTLEELFTKEELESNERFICQLNEDYNALYRLDEIDIAIAVIAGMIGATVDILLVGVPKKSKTGLKAGTLSDYIRDYFDKMFPEEEIQKLANSKISKVPYDAQDNRHTTIHVEGLSAYYHRLLQLGHDPLLGFVFGVLDILTGRMTTIDKSGNIVSQIMENYAERREITIFSALAKQIIHFKSDITTSMGLPVPLMGLFNLFQFGSIGEEEQTIAEIVQGMYYEGYDFIHFCSMSIPTMLVEVVVRMGYAIKRIKEGHSVKDSIPISLNREKNPKLSTMLFMGHSTATAVNAGKVCFTQNPLAINYPEWIAFTKYSYSQLKWSLINKPMLRDSYVCGKINEELQDILVEADRNFEEFSLEYTVIFN